MCLPWKIGLPNQMEGRGFWKGRTNLGSPDTALPTLSLSIDVICEKVINALEEIGKGVSMSESGQGTGQGRSY